MKNSCLTLALLVIFGFASCDSSNQQTDTTEVTTQENTEPAAGQASVQDEESQKNVVQIAASSQDHSTLVAAVKAAGLVDVLANAGPFTVFAPTNAAFDKLPKGTVNGLLKPEKKDYLNNILQYHVYVGGLNTTNLQDGQTLGQVNGGRVTIGVQDSVYTINGAKIIASIPASNGYIHVIDQVLLPK